MLIWGLMVTEEIWKLEWGVLNLCACLVGSGFRFHASFFYGIFPFHYSWTFIVF